MKPQLPETPFSFLNRLIGKTIVVVMAGEGVSMTLQSFDQDNILATGNDGEGFIINRRAIDLIYEEIAQEKAEAEGDA